MDENFWQNRWKMGEIAFHQQDIHPQLLMYFNRLQPGKIMVPLCGKSLDILWIHSQGREIVGAELSNIACEAFFKENNLPVEKTKMGEIIVYRSGKITIYNGDFFKIPMEAWTDVKVIYDRAALIALQPEMRQQYAKEILSRIDSKNAEMFLITLDYPQDKVQGPPFSVTELETKQLYGKIFTKIEKLDRRIDPESSARSKFANLQVFEEAYLLKI